MRKSAAVTVVPNRNQITNPKPISTAAAMNGSDRTEIVDPLPYAQAHDVEAPSATTSSDSDATSANSLLSASA